MENTVRIYRSNHLENLLEKLAEVVRLPPPSVTEPECIVVQSRGMATWVTLRLAQRFEVWANPHFPHPRQFLQTVLHAALGEAGKGIQRFSREHLSFAILELLASLPVTSEYAGIRGYLREAAAEKRLQLAHRLAYVFDQYMIYRPELLLAWEENRRGAVVLGEDDRWQPLLWRALMAHLQSPSPVRLMREAFQALVHGDLAHPAMLPSRVSIFGIVSLPRLYLQMLSSLARLRPVHFFLTAPTPFYWGDIRSRQEVLRSAGRGEPGPYELHAAEGHPLLAALGGLGRDFHDILEEDVDYLEPDDGLFVFTEAPPTVLTQLQNDILNLRCRGPAASPPLPFPSPDRSLEIHACHSALRELEVLRDHLLALLSGDDPCQPHEILVMVPDLSGYLPMIAAVFDGGPDDPRAIPYQVADLSETGGALLVEAFFSLLGLVRSRFRPSDLMPLLEHEAIRQRFRIEAADLHLLQDRLRSAGVRWGIDETHREIHGQPKERQNTWRFGLDRILLGYAMLPEGGQTFGDVLPAEEIEGKEAELLGAFIHFCETLFDHQARLAAENSLPGWQALLHDLLAALFLPSAEEAWQIRKIREALARLVTEAADAGYAGTLTLPELESLLREKLTATPSPYGFLEGGVTFCEMLPMRSIPFPVICILGMNDGAFPREKDPLSFDLIARYPQKGDRSLRGDDLYLFLESLLSARRKLWLSYVGFSSRDNARLAPSVIVDELLDGVAETFYLEGVSLEDQRQKLAELLVTSHPLQPVSTRYFDGCDPRLFSYAGQYCEAARRGAAPKSGRPRFLEKPLAVPAGEYNRLDLADLRYFFSLPVRWLLQRHLDLHIAGPEEEPDERQPLFLAALEEYRLRDELLDRRELEEGALYRLLRGQGRLPVGGAGRLVFQELQEEVQPLARQLASLTAAGRLAPLAAERDLSDGRLLTGSIDGRYRPGLVRFTNSRGAAGFLLKAWMEHLFLCAVSPADQEPVTWLLYRGEKKPFELKLFRTAVSPRDLLADLVGFFVAGQGMPLPFFPKASLAFASALHGTEGDDHGLALAAARSRARAAFYGDPFTQASFEGDSPYVRQVWGEADPLARTDAAHVETAPDFETLSLRVCFPLLEHLETVA